METIQATEILTTIADTLVSLGKYRDRSAAIKGMALDQVDRKIALYQRRLRRLEKKHGMNFEEFTEQLRGKATIADEDEWFEWESAIYMLEEWKNVKGAVKAC
jgi:hypothetical protein